MPSGATGRHRCLGILRAVERQPCQVAMPLVGCESGPGRGRMITFPGNLERQTGGSGPQRQGGCVHVICPSSRSGHFSGMQGPGFLLAPALQRKPVSSGSFHLPTLP